MNPDPATNTRQRRPDPFLRVLIGLSSGAGILFFAPMLATSSGEMWKVLVAMGPVAAWLIIRWSRLSIIAHIALAALVTAGSIIEARILGG